MKEQIEEMFNIIVDGVIDGEDNNGVPTGNTCADIAEALYNAGYRKQKEGEWKRIEVNGENYGQIYYQHKNCKVNETQIFQSPYHFCPNCGSKMKGGE